MNCQAVQNQILALPDPRELPPALREHVLGCAACRAWAKQAARLEAILEQLPVPAAPGEKKEAMLGDLMSADPVILPMATTAKPPSFGALAGRFLRRNAKAVGALAAGVLLVIGVILLWPKKEQGPMPDRVEVKDPLLEKLVTYNAAMARADSPAKRLELLGNMADAIASDTRGVARVAPGDKLKQRAGLYENVVRDAMAAPANQLRDQHFVPATEKAQVFNTLADKLKAEATAAENLAKEAPQDAQLALKRMADAAREGEKSLRSAAEGK
jgi:hypothetical protein